MQVLVGGGQDADVDLDALGAAEPLEGLVLEGTDDLALGFQRHVGDFVEQEGAAVGAFQHAGAAGVGGGVGPGLDAEQLFLESGRVEGGAVEGDEGAFGAAAALVDHAGGDLLAGAGGAVDEHAGAGGGDTLDGGAEGGDGGAGAGQLRVDAGAESELGVFAGEARGLERAADDEEEAVGLEGLLDEVVGAVLDGGDGGLDGAVAGDHDDGDVGLLDVHGLQDAEAVEPGALEPDVEDDERGAAVPEGGHGLVAVAGLADGVALVFQHAFDEHADIGLVIDDEDFLSHRGLIKPLSAWAQSGAARGLRWRRGRRGGHRGRGGRRGLP